MISRSDAELILSCALSTGGDFAEIFAENVNSGGIALLDSRVEGANRARSCGAGIRIFRETETVYAYTNDLTLEGMLETAHGCRRAGQTLRQTPHSPIQRQFAQYSPHRPLCR